MIVLDKPIKITFEVDFCIYLKKDSDDNSHYVKSTTKPISTKNLTLIPDSQYDKILLEIPFENYKKILGDKVTFNGGNKYIDSSDDTLHLKRKSDVYIIADKVQKYINNGAITKYEEININKVRNMSIDDIVSLYYQTLFEGVKFEN